MLRTLVLVVTVRACMHVYAVVEKGDSIYHLSALLLHAHTHTLSTHIRESNVDDSSGTSGSKDIVRFLSVGAVM